MIYSEKYGGYIADVPNVDFLRCDGRQFTFDQLNSASFAQTNNSLTINGGWSSFAQAVIETDKELTCQMESSQFTMELFEMSYANNGVEGDVGVLETSRAEVKTGLKVTLPFEVMANSVKIYNLTDAGSGEAAEGKFKVAITASAADTAGKTEITFAAADATVGDYISVSYRRRVVDAYTVTQKTDGVTARGEIYYHYPVYSSGSDCTEAGRKGYVHLHIYRVRISETPGLDGSYKSASTYSLTAVSLDPRRPDHKISEVIWEPLDAEGNIVNKSANTVDWGGADNA